MLAATRDSEEQSRVLFEMNPLPLWVYDLATLEILEVNEATVCHYGYSREECLKFTLTDIRPPEDIPRLQAYFDRYLRGHPTGNVRFAGVWRHRKKDGIEGKGIGFDTGEVLKTQSSSGISGMQERANLLGGQFQVESARGSGTRLLAEFPISVSENGASHGHDHRARR